MSFAIAEDVRPQAKLLAVATVLSIGLWLLSIYLPIVNWLFYPLQLFATFIHEGGHVLAAVLTGSHVQSLTVSPDGSGVVWSRGSGGLSQLFISSAGYVGTTAFAVLLLVWMRYGRSSRAALYFSAAFVAVMTLVFGVIAPVWNLFANVSIGSVGFTVFAGFALAAGLSAIAHYAPLKWVNFAVAFIAVQSLLNAVFSLTTLFFISATSTTHSDAVNMAEATGIPAILWVIIWIAVSVVIISAGLRIYTVRSVIKEDTVFEDI